MKSLIPLAALSVSTSPVIEYSDSRLINFFLIASTISCCVNVSKSIFIFSACKKGLIIENKPITHETKFGGIYIHVTIDEFNDLGFDYGDSLDVNFSNGYELLDLPYYNGYYTNTGEPLVVAYPGYPYISMYKQW